MPITLGSNIASLRAQRLLSQDSSALSKVAERLASGQRINRASDDAAGLSVAANLNAGARTLTQALRNANDGISVLSVADGALQELSNVVTRIKELAEQAANGVYSSTQRTAMDNEAQQLSAEYTRILRGTKFNGIALLDGNQPTTQLQVGSDGSSSSMLGVSLSGLLGRTTGTGVFGSEQVFAAAGSVADVVIGDFNGDGKADFASNAGSGGSTVVYLGNGDGTFKFDVNLGDGATFGMAGADLNNDGRTDLVIQGGYAVYFGQADGSMAYQALTGNGDASTLFDANHDGNIDIVYRNAGTLGVILNNGDGTFKSHVDYAITGATQTLTNADFNGDGIPDVAVGGSGFFKLLINAGDGTFGAAVSLAAATSPMATLRAGDFNNDGKQDLLTSGSSGNTELLLGNGNGTFQASRTIASLIDNDGTHLAVADLNGDGNLDYVRDSNAKVYVHLGNGDGTFSELASVPTSTNTGHIALGDLNGDGVPDLLMSGQAGANVGIFFQQTVSTAALQSFSLATAASARSALDGAGAALDQIGQARAAIGSYQSRLQATVANLGASIVNYRDAAGRITDADIAADSAELVRRSIMQQAAASVLAQANQEPALALSLLRR